MLEIREFKLSYLISWMEEEFLHENEFCNIESSHNTSWIGYRILAQSIKMSHDCNSFSISLLLSISLYSLSALFWWLTYRQLKMVQLQNSYHFENWINSYLKWYHIWSIRYLFSKIILFVPIFFLYVLNSSKG